MIIAADHPKPEVRARVAEYAEIPRSARTLMKLAAECDWDSFVTYARGTTPGTKPHVVELVTVRLRREGSPTLIGMWIDQMFDTAFSSVCDRLLFGQLKARVVGES